MKQNQLILTCMMPAVEGVMKVRQVDDTEYARLINDALRHDQPVVAPQQFSLPTDLNTRLDKQMIDLRAETENQEDEPKLYYGDEFLVYTDKFDYAGEGVNYELFHVKFTRR